MIATVPGRTGLAAHGIESRGDIHWRPSTSQLYTHAVAAGDGQIAEGGPLVVDTGAHTGRSPKDKFIVREPGSEDRIWWSDVNASITPAHFERLRERVAAHLGEGDVYVVDAFAGADPAHRIAVRIVSG
nr:phosphoenolpyruvate carboxykinase (ATP) [Actinomycetota bacterium]